VTKTTAGVVILKTVLSTFTHNMSGLLPINEHDMNKDQEQLTLI
jgi:hypothetical protein